MGKYRIGADSGKFHHGEAVFLKRQNDLFIDAVFLDAPLTINQEDLPAEP